MSQVIYVKVKIVNHSKIAVISYKVAFFLIFETLAYKFLEKAYRVSLLNHYVM